MSDTVSYVRAAASGFYKLLGIKSDWTNEYVRIFGSAPAANLHSIKTAADVPVTLSGRSVYYGAFLLITDLFGTFWLAVIAQCILAATAITLTVQCIVRADGRRPRLEPLFVGLIAAVATPLGYFTGYLMPDVFGGFALLATASLLFLARFQSLATTLFWYSLLGFSLLAHSSNPPIVLGMAAFAVIYSQLARIHINKSNLAGIIACVCVALIGQLAFAQAVKAGTGASPIRPPFLAIRIISDGPGYRYLQTHCPTEPYIYCRVLRSGNQPSDTLLWSNDPQVSLFRGLPAPEQRQSADEQTQFVQRVFRSDPLGVITEAAENSVRQLADFRLAEFNYAAVARSRFDTAIPSRVMHNVISTRAYKERMPTHWMEIATALAVVVGLVIILMATSPAGDSDRRRRLLRGYCFTILSGIVMNAIICGSISGPNGRYEMRLVWVLPMIAAALAFNRTWRSAPSLGIFQRLARNGEPLSADHVPFVRTIANAERAPVRR